MRNKFRKPIKCELRLFFMFGTTFPLSLYMRTKWEYIGLNTVWTAMQYELYVLLVCLFADNVWTAVKLIVLTFIFHHRSYNVETSNSLTSFVDFRFKDSLLKKKYSAIHIFRFTKLISQISFFLFVCELRFFSC